MVRGPTHGTLSWLVLEHWGKAWTGVYTYRMTYSYMLRKLVTKQGEELGRYESLGSTLCLSSAKIAPQGKYMSSALGTNGFTSVYAGVSSQTTYGVCELSILGSSL